MTTFGLCFGHGIYDNVMTMVYWYVTMLDLVLTMIRDSV